MQLNVWNELAKAKRRWTEKNMFLVALWSGGVALTPSFLVGLLLWVVLLLACSDSLPLGVWWSDQWFSRECPDFTTHR
jgi:hypothetical protein